MPERVIIDLDTHHPRCDTTPNHHGDQRECARVTLDRAGKTSPHEAELSVSVPMEAWLPFDAELRWSASTERERETHGNTTDATERGAEAVAIISVLNAPTEWSRQISRVLERVALVLAACAV